MMRHVAFSAVVAARSFEEVELPSVMPPTSFVVTELAY